MCTAHIFAYSRGQKRKISFPLRDIEFFPFTLLTVQHDYEVDLFFESYFKHMEVRFVEELRRVAWRGGDRLVSVVWRLQQGELHPPGLSNIISKDRGSNFNLDSPFYNLPFTAKF